MDWLRAAPLWTQLQFTSSSWEEMSSPLVHSKNYFQLCHAMLTDTFAADTKFWSCRFMTFVEENWCWHQFCALNPHWNGSDLLAVIKLWSTLKLMMMLRSVESWRQNNDPMSGWCVQEIPLAVYSHVVSARECLTQREVKRRCWNPAGDSHQSWGQRDLAFLPRLLYPNGIRTQPAALIKAASGRSCRRPLGSYTQTSHDHQCTVHRAAPVHTVSFTHTPRNDTFWSVVTVVTAVTRRCPFFEK
jgi:hypothetical protein